MAEVKYDPSHHAGKDMTPEQLEAYNRRADELIRNRPPNPG
jgi:hypothetical protein